MLDIIKKYLPLCWFDTNPLDLEKSSQFLKLNGVFFWIVQYFLQTNMTDDPVESFFEVSYELVLLFVFMGVMLFFDKMLYAYVQLTSAVLFCTNVLSIFFIPVMVWLTVTEEPLSYYAMTIWALWFYSVIAVMFKTALAINTIASLALSLLYFTVVYLGALGLGQL